MFRYTGRSGEGKKKFTVQLLAFCCREDRMVNQLIKGLCLSSALPPPPGLGRSRDRSLRAAPCSGARGCLGHVLACYREAAWCCCRGCRCPAGNRCQATFNPLLSRLADVYLRFFGIQPAKIFGRVDVADIICQYVSFNGSGQCTIGLQ